MKNPTLLNYIYYHCTKRAHPECTQGCVLVEVLEKQISEFLQSIHINQKYLDWALKYLREEHEGESKERQAIQLTRQQAYNGVCKKLDKLADMRINDELTEAEYSEKKASLLKEKEHYQELLGDSDNGQNKSLRKVEEVLSFASKVRLEFENATLQRKREILHALGSNLTLKDKKLSIYAYEPFVILQTGVTAMASNKVRFEPENYTINKRQAGSFDEVCPLWLARRVQNHSSGNPRRFRRNRVRHSGQKA